MAEVKKELAPLEDRIKQGAQEYLAKLDGHDRRWKENAGVCVVLSSGGFCHSTTEVCHAGLSYIKGEGKREAVVSILMDGSGYAQGRLLAPEVELAFLDYLLNRSPYESIFISRDAKQALEDKYIVTRCDVPSNLMAAGLVASRRLWEYPNVARAWYDLSQGGVNEDLAFFLGHCIATGWHYDPKAATSWTGCYAGHCSLAPNHTSYEGLANFMAHKLQSPNANYDVNTSYRGYDCMFNKGGAATKDKERPHGDLVNFDYSSVVGSAVNLNPFQKAIPAAKKGTVPYTDAINLMVKYAQNFIMPKVAEYA